MTFIALPYATIYDNDTEGEVWVNPNHVASVAPYRKSGVYNHDTTNLRMVDGSWLVIALPPEEVVASLKRQPHRNQLAVVE